MLFDSYVEIYLIGVERKKAAMARGDHINSTEDRAGKHMVYLDSFLIWLCNGILLHDINVVMHLALRAPKTSNFYVDGVDVVPEVHRVLDNIEVFSDDIRAGRRFGATGKRLTNVISIGIGGSYLGMKFMMFELFR